MSSMSRLSFNWNTRSTMLGRSDVCWPGIADRARAILGQAALHVKVTNSSGHPNRRQRATQSW
jgi:hypothetical protein